MRRPLRCALIGCGRVAQKYVAIFKSGQVPELELAGVCDHVQEKAFQLGREGNVPHFVSTSEMMKAIGSEIDLFCILTESGNHFRSVLELLPYQKSLLVEKPFGMNQDECGKMIRAAKQEGVEIFVVKQNRYNPAVRKIKEILDEQLLGDIFLTNIRMRWCRSQEYYNQDSWRGTERLDGGVLTNQAIHFIDILQWYLGMPHSVYTEGFRFGAKIEMEDTAVGIFHFPNRSIAVLEATTAARPKDLEGSISLLGSKGAAEIGGRCLTELKSLWIDGQNLTETTPLPPPDGHISYLKAVAKSISSDQPPEVDGVEGMKSVRILDAMYQSMREEKRVLI